MLSRWPWIAIGFIVCGTLGALAGIKITHQSFAIPVSLIKRRVPHTVQTSETGQAYRPVDFNDATLLATLTASEPLDLAVKRSKNGIDPNAARTLIEAKQLEGTDIYFITYHSPVSPEDAVNFSSIWAEEINAYTKRLQQTEAHEVRLILQKEVSDMGRQIDATNLEILNFSKLNDYLGGEAQVAAALSKLSLIELQLETARSTAAAKTEQLKNLTGQIQRQSPLELQLRTARDELANLRATYTDVNPLVQAKLQSLEYLGAQIAKLGEKVVNEADLDSYTGTPLGNQLFLSILTLDNELLQANSQIRSLEKLAASAAKRIAQFPAIISGYDAMKKKRDAINEGLSIMSNRLKEAEIFASGAPGYWQIFQAPDPRRIVPSSLVAKPAILGAAGGTFGAAIATLLTLLLSHRTSRRSILECCAATRAPLVANLPHSPDEDARAAIDHFWITHLAPRLNSPAQILFWTAAVNPADERRFWSMLAAAASKDTGAPLRIHDLSADPLWKNFPCPDSLEWLPHSPTTPQPSVAMIVRASSLPHGDARDVLTRVDYWMSVVSGDKTSLRLTVESRLLTDAYLPPCNGTIAWIERPQGPIRQTADVLSGFLTQRFS